MSDEPTEVEDEPAPAITRRFSAELEKRILRRIRAGNSFLVSAMAEGVPKRLHYEWLAAARDETSIHAERRPKMRQRLIEYLEKVDQHYALFEADCVEKLKRPPDDWLYVDKGGSLRVDRGRVNATTWMLERTRRERFGLRVTVDDIRPQAASELLDRLREGLDAAAFARCLDILVPDGGDGGEGDGGVGADDSLPLC